MYLPEHEPLLVRDPAHSGLGGPSPSSDREGSTERSQTFHLGWPGLQHARDLHCVAEHSPRVVRSRASGRREPDPDRAADQGSARHPRTAPHGNLRAARRPATVRRAARASAHDHDDHQHVVAPDDHLSRRVRAGQPARRVGRIGGSRSRDHGGFRCRAARGAISTSGAPDEFGRGIAARAVRPGADHPHAHPGGRDHLLPGARGLGIRGLDQGAGGSVQQLHLPARNRSRREPRRTIQLLRRGLRNVGSQLPALRRSGRGAVDVRIRRGRATRWPSSTSAGGGSSSPRCSSGC